MTLRLDGDYLLNETWRW